MTLVLSNFKENWTSRTIEKKNFQILCLLLFTILSVSYNLYSIYTIYMKHIDIIFSFGICCELFWWWIILFGFKKKEYFPIIREIMVYYTNGILVINSYSKSSGRFWRSILIHFFQILDLISNQWKHLIEKFTKQIDCDHSTTPFIYLFFSVYAYTSDYYSGGMLLISSHYITDLGRV